MISMVAMWGDNIHGDQGGGGDQSRSTGHNMSQWCHDVSQIFGQQVQNNYVLREMGSVTVTVPL